MLCTCECVDVCVSRAGAGQGGLFGEGESMPDGFPKALTFYFAVSSGTEGKGGCARVCNQQEGYVY